MTLEFLGICNIARSKEKPFQHGECDQTWGGDTERPQFAILRQRVSVLRAEMDSALTAKLPFKDTSMSHFHVIQIALFLCSHYILSIMRRSVLETLEKGLEDEKRLK